MRLRQWLTATVAAGMFPLPPVAMAANHVSVTSLTVAPGQSNVTVPIFLTNDVPLRVVLVPLMVREISPGAYIRNSVNLAFGDRLTSTLYDLRLAQWRENEDGTCKSGSSGGFGTLTSGIPPFPGPFNSPSGFMLGAHFIFAAPLLQPGTDATGSLLITLDVTNTPGMFEIDTTCTDPANHLIFVADPIAYIYPTFTKGYVCIGQQCPPSSPVVLNLLDAGTGGDLVIQWTHPQPTYITEFDVAWGLSPDDLSSGSIPGMPVAGNGPYSKRIVGVTEHFPYYVGVRARNAVTGLWSSFAVAGPIRATLPVVFVHGLGSDTAIWNDPSSTEDYRSWLETAGLNHIWIADNLEPCGVEGEEHFGGNAESLATFIEDRIAAVRSQTNVDIPAINIVGHSMGGLIARRYLSVPTQTRCPSPTWVARQVRNLIMLGVPNAGSKLASRWRLHGFLGQWRCNPATSEMTVGKMKDFNSCYNTHPGTSYYLVPGWGGHLYQGTCSGLLINPCCDLFGSASIEDCPNDGVVSVASVMAVDFAARRYDGWCHGSRSLASCLVTRRSVVRTYYTDHDLLETFVRPILTGEPVSPTMDIFAEVPDSTVPAQVFVTVCDSTASGGAVTASFQAESGAAVISIFTSSPELEVSLISPGGFTWDSLSAALDPAVTYSSFDWGVGFAFEAMETGTWNLKLDGAMLTDPWGYACLAGVSSNAVFANASVVNESLAPGDSEWIHLTLTSEGNPVTGAAATAYTYHGESPQPDSTPLNDDGVDGDEVAMDGVYTGAFSAGPEGPIEISIQVSGNGPGGLFSRSLLLSAYTTSVPCLGGCPFQADLDASGFINAVDLAMLIDIVFFGASDIQDANCPRTRADFNADGVANAVDLALIIDHIFFGGAGPTDPCAP